MTVLSRIHQEAICRIYEKKCKNKTDEKERARQRLVQGTIDVAACASV